MEFVKKALRKSFLPIANPPRPMTLFMVRKFKDKSLIGVEIGVAQANNAKSMMENLHIKKLYLVDPYEPYREASKMLDYGLALLLAKKRLSRFQQKTVFIKKKSSEAIQDIPNNLDFVYIDGNHNYEFVKKDIELYYPKVRLGGVIGGHDFNASCIGVCRAVIEFIDQKKLKFQGEKDDWWIMKNGACQKGS